MKTVLLADDLKFTRVILSRAIRSIEDCEVIEVENGEQALEALRNNNKIDVDTHHLHRRGGQLSVVCIYVHAYDPTQEHNLLLLQQHYCHC